MDADGSSETLNLPSLGRTKYAGENNELPESSDSHLDSDRNETLNIDTGDDGSKDERNSPRDSGLKHELDSLPNLEHLDENAVNSLNVMVRKELHDLSKNLPGGNLGNLKLMDAGGEIVSAPFLEEDAHEMRATKKQKTAKGSPTVRAGVERRTWDERAACVFVYLHPRIGHKDYHLTAEMASVSANTLRGWLTKYTLMSKWVPVLREMDAGRAGKMLGLDLNHLGVKDDETVDYSEFEQILKRKNITPIKATPGQKRVQRNPRCSKWNPQFVFAKEFLTNAWENGLPISIRFIRDKLLSRYMQYITPNSLQLDHSESREEEDEKKQAKAFVERYLLQTRKNYPTTVNTIIARMITRAGYTLKGHFLYETPEYEWERKVHAFKSDFALWLDEIKPDCVVCSDEVFFGPYDDTKMVGLKDKDINKSAEEEGPGVIACVSAVLPSSELLKPFIVVYDHERYGEVKIGERRASALAHSSSLKFTPEIIKAVMKNLLQQLPGKKIAWVVDLASFHQGPLFEEALTEVNTDLTLPGYIMPFYIPSSLTSFVNVPHTFLHTILRSRVASALDDRLLASPGLVSNEVPLESEQVDDFVHCIESQFEDFNSKESDISFLKKSFSKAGLNPYEPNADEDFVEWVKEFRLQEDKQNRLMGNEVNADAIDGMLP